MAGKQGPSAAALKVKHSKPVGDRGAILDEQLRSLDPGRVQFWAGENPSIVVADDLTNENFVNDGNGLRKATKKSDIRAALDYGESRVSRLVRKPVEDRWDEKRQKETGGTLTTTMIVAHLPRALCVEVPDFYPVLDDGGQPVLREDGTPLKRPRLVARDRDEARRYFDDLQEFAAQNCYPDGEEGIYARSDQYGESQPHCQLVGDPFGKHPDKPGKLRAEGTRKWFNAEGELGRDKMSALQADLRAFMAARGWPVELEVSTEERLQGLSKADYEFVQDQRRIAEAAREDAEAAQEAARDAQTAAEADRAQAARDRLQAAQEAAQEAEQARQSLERVRALLAEAATPEADGVDAVREVYRRGIAEGHRVTMGLQLTGRLPKAQQLVSRAMAQAPDGAALLQQVGGSDRRAQLVERIDAEAARLDARRSPGDRDRPKD